MIEYQRRRPGFRLSDPVALIALVPHHSFFRARTHTDTPILTSSLVDICVHRLELTHSTNTLTSTSSYSSLLPCVFLTHHFSRPDHGSSPVLHSLCTAYFYVLHLRPVLRSQNMGILRPERSWRPIITLEVDGQHKHEVMLGVDGQNPNQRDTTLLYAPPSSSWLVI